MAFQRPGTSATFQILQASIPAHWRILRACRAFGGSQLLVDRLLGQISRTQQ